MSRMTALFHRVLASDSSGCSRSLADELLRTDGVSASNSHDEEPLGKANEPVEDQPAKGIPTKLLPTDSEPKPDKTNEDLAKEKVLPRSFLLAFNDALRESEAARTPEGNMASVRIVRRPLLDILLDRLLAAEEEKLDLDWLPTMDNMPAEREDAQMLRDKAAAFGLEFVRSIRKIDASLSDEDVANKGEATDVSPDVENLASLVIRNFLSTLNIETILLLLGHRLTVGSAVDTLPPSLSELLSAFLEPHNESRSSKDTKLKPREQILTVGTVALSKHFHRDQTALFWTRFGEYKGTVEHKNMLALRVLVAILGQPAWLNIHQLPHEIRVFEVRNAEGYGARWYLESGEGENRKVTFRGFLEPHMEDGHEKGWVH